MTYFDLVTEARGQLLGAGISSATAALDADLLARHALGWDQSRWLAHRHESCEDGFGARYSALIARRLTREPVAYIRGVQEFWGRDFRINQSVLIPRPETELLVETAHTYLQQHPDSTVVDVGTGSGCIAVTLALEHPEAHVWATDVSREAVEVARANAARLGAHTITFQHGPFLAAAPRPIDLIVSNPPYVAATDRSGLAPEVRDYEPSVALFGGDDGLRDVRTLLQEARTSLSARGRLMMEVGYGQADRVKAEVETVDALVLDEIREDLQGIERVMVVRRGNTR